MTDENTYEAATVWADTYPRRVTRHQEWVHSKTALLREVSNIEGREPGYMSLYSFPQGHTKDEGIPRIDTLFLDFDIPEGAEKSDDWEHELSKLLVRARRLARVIVEEGNPEHWRASLSGNKGIHLFHDFPALDPSEGSFDQFLAGVNKYANKLTQRLTELTGVEDLPEYIDGTVTGDLGRLTRLPNTIHETATAAHGERRYCVPVSVEELQDMRVEQYVKLTQSTRPVPEACYRNPNQKAHDVLAQYIRNSSGKDTGASGQSTDYDNERIDRYKERSNDNITVDDIPLVMQKRPCVTAFLEDEERFNHGGQSHVMEMKIITELLAEQVPIDVIVDALEQGNVDDGFDRGKTYETIERYIAGEFHEPSPINCSTIWDNTPYFKERYCVGKDCDVLNRNT